MNIKSSSLVSMALATPEQVKAEAKRERKRQKRLREEKTRSPRTQAKPINFGQPIGLDMLRDQPDGAVMIASGSFDIQLIEAKSRGFQTFSELTKEIETAIGGVLAAPGEIVGSDRGGSI